MKDRKTLQPLIPLQPLPAQSIYPLHTIGKGVIFEGYASLACWMAKHPVVLLDGYTGVWWERVQQGLVNAFNDQGISVKWHYMSQLMKEEALIEALIAPFTGAKGDVWGTRCTLDILEFFDPVKLHTTAFDPAYDLNIVIGTGAALINANMPVVFLEVPKNELQYRMRAGSVTNFGSSHTTDYKRSYFVDWVILNEYKKALLPRLQVLADTQWADTLTWIQAADLQQGIHDYCHRSFRVRPWFEPGPWGGQWIKEWIPDVNKDEINYAWSFELIAPENGILLESDGFVLEVPFEWWMYFENKAILGVYAITFKDLFPIRFDFLDTWKGGNLSIQCHPSLPYIRKHYGEVITQDETYYILDSKMDAKVYLGFQENIDPASFRAALEYSKTHHTPIPITDYVQCHKANKHDLFLIPNGTIHSAGANNLVLEISATPYIFTFKMYDWLRMGLDGTPRPLSIEQAFDNLDFSRRGRMVERQLIAHPTVIAEGKDWQTIHLPTHAAHFYDVHRVEFDTIVNIETYESCLVMMLVEGTEIEVIHKDGSSELYHYAETFVIPAAAVSCTIVNKGNTRARVLKAFLKP